MSSPVTDTAAAASPSTEKEIASNNNNSEATTNTAHRFGHDDVGEGGRDRRSSRLAFYLAAVGSAVGFGNVWRFPGLAKDYGGGAFFIPYLMALFFIGLPVLILEIALGQVYQTGNVGVLGSFHPRFRGVGMASIACAFMLVVYYSILLVWVVNAFFDSFTDSAPWDEEGTKGDEAVGYFFDNIIGLDTADEDTLRPTRLKGDNVGYLALVWFFIWICLAFGLKWTGRIAYFTMGFPILLLFIFFFRSITLDGASDGIEEYIGKWDMSILQERPDVWSTAVSQIFFSLSVTFGTMTAYGSHCPQNEPAFLNSIVIGIANSSFSFLSGFAVFSAMGHLAHLENVTVDEIPYSGFSLVFGTWPVVFGTLPGGIHWVRLLFVNLFLLGIDSAFSILEGPITVVMDAYEARRVKTGQSPPNKMIVSGAFCFVAFAIGIFYATDGGLYFLDVVDFYINFVLLLVGFLQTFGAGWMYGIEKQIAKFGSPIVYTYMAANFGSVIAASSVWFSRWEENEKNATVVWVGFLVLIAVYVFLFAITCFLVRNKVQNEPERIGTSCSKAAFYELAFGSVMELRTELSAVCGYIWIGWAIMMKQFIPQVLLLLFINLAMSETDAGKRTFGHYGGYEKWPYQTIGIVCVCCAAVLFIIGLLVPSLYEGADLYALRTKQKNGDDDVNYAEPIRDAEEVVKPMDVSSEEDDDDDDLKQK